MINAVDGINNTDASVFCEPRSQSSDFHRQQQIQVVLRNYCAHNVIFINSTNLSIISSNYDSSCIWSDKSLKGMQQHRRLARMILFITSNSGRIPNYCHKNKQNI